MMSGSLVALLAGAALLGTPAAAQTTTTACSVASSSAATPAAGAEAAAFEIEAATPSTLPRLNVQLASINWCPTTCVTVAVTRSSPLWVTSSTATIRTGVAEILCEMEMKSSTLSGTLLPKSWPR
jgi:hypothetical protein